MYKNILILLLPTASLELRRCGVTRICVLLIDLGSLVSTTIVMSESIIVLLSKVWNRRKSTVRRTTVYLLGILQIQSVWVLAAWPVDERQSKLRDQARREPSFSSIDMVNVKKSVFGKSSRASLPTSHILRYVSLGYGFSVGF